MYTIAPYIPKRSKSKHDSVCNHTWSIIRLSSKYLKLYASKIHAARAYHTVSFWVDVLFKFVHGRRIKSSALAMSRIRRYGFCMWVFRSCASKGSEQIPSPAALCQIQAAPSQTDMSVSTRTGFGQRWNCRVGLLPPTPAKKLSS